MSYVVGMLLLHCGPPEECFKLFCNIMNMEVIFQFYNFQLPKIQKTYNVFWNLISTHAPKVYQNLRNDNISCSVFMFEWVLTLFSSTFDIEICANLWDQIFFFGERQIVKIAVAICITLEKKYSATIADKDALALLKKARHHIEKEALMEVLQKLKLSVDKIDALYKLSNKQLLEIA